MPIDQINSKCVAFKTLTDLMVGRYRERLLGQEVESITAAEKLLDAAERVVSYIMEVTEDDVDKLC